MLTLSEETESLAHRVAEAQKLSIDETVRHALEQQARAMGVRKSNEKDRVSDEEIARRRAVIHVSNRNSKPFRSSIHDPFKT